MTVHRADVVLDAELFRLAQLAFAANDLDTVASLLQLKGRERAADRAAAVRALRTDAPEGAVRRGGLLQADLGHTSEVRAPRSPTGGQDHGAPTSRPQGDRASVSVAEEGNTDMPNDEHDLDTVEGLNAFMEAPGTQEHLRHLDEVTELFDRVSWLQRAFVACNRDRRFAWGELNRENDRAVSAERERDALRAQLDASDTGTARDLRRRLLRSQQDYVRDTATWANRVADAEEAQERAERLLDDARLRGYLPELSDASRRPGPHTKYMPLENSPIDVLLDCLEQAYEQSPGEGWWPWVWALINRLYAAVDGVEPDAVRNAAMEAATDAVILVKAIEDGSAEAISYARKIEARLKPWYQWDADA